VGEHLATPARKTSEFSSLLGWASFWGYIVVEKMTVMVKLYFIGSKPQNISLATLADAHLWHNYRFDVIFGGLGRFRRVLGGFGVALFARSAKKL